MKKRQLRNAAILLALICQLAGQTFGERAAWDCPECGRKGNTGKFCGGCAHPAPAYSVGDIITFGHYEQDNNPNNGMEQIEWIVLEYDAAGNKALLLSRYGLDAKPYHSSWEDITWEKCTLRSWLNGEFLKTAFTEEEQLAILKTNVDNSKSQGYSLYSADGGNNTIDQVFLLSHQEVFEKNFAEDQSRTCKATPYAVGNGCHSYWWLRSPGANQDYAIVINNSVDSFTSLIVDDDSSCVRPAFWLNLDSGNF